MSKILGAIMLLAGFTGCSSLEYLTQAAGGQLKLISRARPIDEVLKDPRTDPDVAQFLREVPSVLDFVQRQGLKKTKSYQAYVKWDSKILIHVVIASKPYAFEPKTWSFPIAGSFNYLGFFDENMAVKTAKELRGEGYDVDVRASQAFSTLGWFHDPLISTMLPDSWDEVGDLVNVLIHESTHATLYIPNQTSFNEQLAVFVADKLTPKYLAERFGKDSPQVTKYSEMNQRSEAREKLFLSAYQQLSTLYDSHIPQSEMEAQKQKIFSDLREKLGTKRIFNNASLVHLKTYRPKTEAWGELFDRCHQDVQRLLRGLGKLRAQSFEHPQQEEFSKLLSSVNCD